MPKLILNTTMASPEGVFNAGSIYETTDLAAKGLIEGGFAFLAEKLKENKEAKTQAEEVELDPEEIEEEPEEAEPKKARKAK